MLTLGVTNKYYSGHYYCFPSLLMGFGEQYKVWLKD